MLEKNGLVKLSEECGELIVECIELYLARKCARLSQVAAKKMTRMDSDEHWDGAGSLKERLENEIADTAAAMRIVSENLELDEERMKKRFEGKIKLFQKWMKEADQEI